MLSCSYLCVCLGDVVRKVGSGVSVCDAALGVAVDPGISRLCTAGRAGVPLRAPGQSPTRAGTNRNSHTSHRAGQSETPDQTGAQRGQYYLSRSATQPGEECTHSFVVLKCVHYVILYICLALFVGKVFGV